MKCPDCSSQSGLQKEMTTWARAFKGKSYQAPCSETLSLAVYVGVHGCGICVVHARSSIILWHAQSQGLSADLWPTTLSFGAACCALQSLVKSLKFENSCDLAETFQRQEMVHVHTDSILFACHRTSCNHINPHTTTIADHWHVEHLLASQMLTHKELGFEFIWRGITCTQVKSHIVNSQSSQYKSNSYESAKMQQ